MGCVDRADAARHPGPGRQPTWDAGSIISAAIVAATLSTGSAVAGQGPSSDPLPADWIVFEHFGQAPDGSTPEFDFHLRQIWLVHPDGSDLHELSPRAPAQGKASPDVSPDGARVIFHTWQAPNRIWEVGIDGEDLRLISEDCSGRDGDCAEADPAYSADGRRVAFVHVGWRMAPATPRSASASSRVARRRT